MSRSEYIAVLFTAALLGGCAEWAALRPVDPPTATVERETGIALALLLKLHSSTGAQREALWDEVAPRPGRPPSKPLHVALLQSFPGHSGTDYAAAETRLKVLINKYRDSEVGAVAKLRLIELRAERQFAMQREETTAELKQLKSQLSELIQIEQRLDRKWPADR